jgi:hypothetical protein
VIVVDLEGHVGRDGKFYIIDASRLFPPTIPDKKYLNVEIKN